jgi:hypothetical protein
MCHRAAGVAACAGTVMPKIKAVAATASKLLMRNPLNQSALSPKMIPCWGYPKTNRVCTRALAMLETGIIPTKLDIQKDWC